MTLYDLICVYKQYNDLEILVCEKQGWGVIETIKGENLVYDKYAQLLDKEVLGMRAIPYQSEENAYFMDNEMRVMIRAKVKVWVRQ